MITAYHRPQSLDEALQLISRTSPVTVPLGGGTILSQHHGDSIEVVDLQALSLDRISRNGKNLKLGAAVTLQALIESPECPKDMALALKLEAPLNLRNSATIAGTLVVCDGRSSFATTVLALNAQLTIMNPGSSTMGVGEFLPLRDQLPRGFLISEMQVPLTARIAFDYVARTPADKPIVAVALAQWPSGRTRVAVGGCDSMPLLAMDGTEAQGIEPAVRNALHDARDPWGSAEYRMDAAATLARRCLERLNA